MLNSTSAGDLLRQAELWPLRGPWPARAPGVYAISYGRDHVQPVYVGQAGDLFRRIREHWYWLRWRRGLAMDGLRYRARPLASRGEARAVERVLIDRWHSVWNAHRGRHEGGLVRGRAPESRLGLALAEEPSAGTLTWRESIH